MALRGGITLKDVYDVVNRLEDKFDDRYSEIDARVTKLEGFQNKALGILTIATAFVSLAASYVWQKVFHT